MTLTDKEIQELQGITKKSIQKENGSVIQIPGQNKFYKVVNQKDDVTQALAVVPVDNADGANPNYQETTILVAGTQVPFEHMKYWDDQSYFWKKDFDIAESSANAFITSGWFGTVQGGLTPQTADIDQFYQETLEKAKSEDKNAIISNMSGHSQAGPGVAYTASKYGLQEHRSIKVTNFMDFEAHDAVASGAISKEQVAYLNKNATIYRDSRGDVVVLDGDGGDVPYGKTMRFEVVEGDDGHSPQTPVMKGNKLDVDWYYKRNRFATGMTEKQVREIAKKKAENAKLNKITANYGLGTDKLDPEYYVKEYKKIYGAFASEPSRLQLLEHSRKRIAELQSGLTGRSGSQLIRLREELLLENVQTARLQPEEFAARLN
ncbi:hypothetical protein, partial [Streptococcus sp. DD11]|uniref:hypothetical protein n=1 Tax=Streptococcus sp. DD11 TaxID=1777879 RepID=UPI0010081702